MGNFLKENTLSKISKLYATSYIVIPKLYVTSYNVISFAGEGKHNHLVVSTSHIQQF